MPFSSEQQLRRKIVWALGEDIILYELRYRLCIYLLVLDYLSYSVPEGVTLTRWPQAEITPDERLSNEHREKNTAS